MLGMHGSVYANYAVERGRPAARLRRAVRRPRDRQGRRVRQARQDRPHRHRPSEINKNKEAHIPIVSDMKYALAELNKVVEPPDDIAAWHEQIDAWKESDPFSYNELVRRHPAAARHRRAVEAHARSRHDHHRRRRPAPDVGGPVLQVRTPAHVALQLAAWARWASACRPRWARRPPTPTSW